MTDDLSRRLAEQILRGVKVLHAAAERIGISPVGRWYAAAVKYLEEEGALEPNMRPGDVEGDPRYVLGESAPELLEDL